MRLLIACDKFRGSLTATEANEAILAGLAGAELAAEALTRAIADGGEGTLDAFAAAVPGALRRARVAAPLGGRVEAPFFLGADGSLAVVECAAAVGHHRVDRHDPDRATSHGVGSLIAAALDAGARRIVLGLGGSVTVDGGAGLLEALGARHLDAAGEPIARPAGRRLAEVARVDLSGVDPRLCEAVVEVASDVDNPLAGENGAAAVFGPQKGVAPADVTAFDAALCHYDRVIAEARGGAPLADEPFAGAAGGMIVGLSAARAPVCRDGFALLAEATGLAGALAAADLVVTGEGSLDGQSLGGKGPVALARMARERGTPCIAFAGRLAVDPATLAAEGVTAAFPLPAEPTTLAEALGTARTLLAHRAESVFRLLAATGAADALSPPGGRRS